MSFNGPMSDISDNVHSLLEPPSPAYSNVTVRRAFVVWMYCGQRNKFKDVCNYFHHLEALEDQLPPEKRALSRHHEFNLFSNQPPTSNYLIDNFPHLYKDTHVERHHIPNIEETQNEKCVFKQEGFNEISKVEKIRNEKSIFKVKEFNEIAPNQGTTTQEIVEASRLIRNYCRIQMVSLKKFLEEFQQHASKCGLKHTVNNVVFYIKRKLVQAEIELEANYPKTLGFLNSNSAENVCNDMPNATIKDNHTLGDWKIGSGCKKEEVEGNIKPAMIVGAGIEESFNVTKNYYSVNTDMEKIIFKEESPKNFVFDKNESEKTAETMKSRSKEDFTDEGVPFKKERRFSGSRFMKIELEKFRKI